MRDYFLYQGISNINGLRDATREAFHKGLIENGGQWMEMIRSRNLSSHTYNEDVAREICDKIFNDYYELFLSFEEKMHTLLSQ